MIAARAMLAACLVLSGALPAGAQRAGDVPVPALVEVPAGSFIAGSDAAEREYGYRLDEAAYGHSRTRERGWYDRERPRGVHELGGFLVTRTPITNAHYAAFVNATGHRVPDVDEETWRGYRLIHPYSRTRRHAWAEGAPPPGREDHPVVMVSHDDALAYAAWLSAGTGRTLAAPDRARMGEGRARPGGARLPLGRQLRPRAAQQPRRRPLRYAAGRQLRPAGASPYGLLDAAGQVFEWTASPGNPGRFLVKGGSWDDSGCGICRPAARHGRPAGIKHILVGFRLVVAP